MCPPMVSSAYLRMHYSTYRGYLSDTKVNSPASRDQVVRWVHLSSDTYRALVEVVVCRGAHAHFFHPVSPNHLNYKRHPTKSPKTSNYHNYHDHVHDHNRNSKYNHNYNHDNNHNYNHDDNYNHNHDDNYNHNHDDNYNHNHDSIKQ
jgi:hypothetical protein